MSSSDVAESDWISIPDMNGKWVFAAQVGNLKLTKAVNNEYKVKLVTFISGAKFRRILKRLNIDPSVVKSNPEFKTLLLPEVTLGILNQSGKISDIEPMCLQMIRDELEILSSSQLYYRRRRSSCTLGLIGESNRGTNKYAFMDTKSDKGIVSSAVADRYSPLTLDKQWKNYHKGYFFGRFMKILHGKVQVNKSWLQDLTRSVRLVGKSFNSNDIGSSFLWNMVALEMLLSRQGDKYSIVIPKRIEALLGWIGFWKTAKFSERIMDIYKLRCKIVHDGRLDLVTPKDLVFTEDLLVNVLFNLVRHPQLFKSKEDLIQFTEMVGAEHLLGKKSKVRPKSLTYIRRKYTQKDLEI